VDDDDNQLPGELDPGAQAEALKQFGLQIMEETLPGIEDDVLDRMLLIFHEEWHRRHPEHGSWVVVL
jgi:hypothetical protein